MTLKTKDGREVEPTHTEGEYSEGAFIVEARFCDNNEPVDDETLDELNERYSEDIYEAWTMDQVCRAEARADAAQDR